MANPFHSICICLFTYCTGITLVNSPISSYYCIHPIHVCIHPQLLLLVTVMYCTVVTAEPEHGASARQTNSSLACIVLMDIISYDPGHMVCSGLTWLFLESVSIVRQRMPPRNLLTPVNGYQSRVLFSLICKPLNMGERRELDGYSSWMLAVDMDMDIHMGQNGCGHGTAWMLVCLPA